MESIEPRFTADVTNGLVPVYKVRGKKDVKIKSEDMIIAQDQALLEWLNVQFFVPVKKPAQETTPLTAESLLDEDNVLLG